MKERTIVSAFTLAGSLASYFYAKFSQKDAVPYVMIGGFVGAVIGEAVAELISPKDNPPDDNPPPTSQD